MVYGDKNDIRAMTGFTTSEVSDDDLDIIIASADRVIDSEPEIDASDNLKREMSNNLSASFACRNVSGVLSKTALMELVDAFKVDTRTKSTLLQGNSKSFFERYLYLLSLTTNDNLVLRSP